MPEAINITPSYTAEEAQRVNEALDHKNHVQYQCAMMLDFIDKHVPLRSLIKDAVRRGTCEEDLEVQLFGDPKKDEDAGVVEADGHTIESLLNAWRDSNERLINAVSKRG